MRFTEVAGTRKEDAIQKAARELNVPVEEIGVEVLSDSSRGFFSLIGGRKVKIRAWSKRESREQLREEVEKIKDAMVPLTGPLTDRGWDPGSSRENRKLKNGTRGQEAVSRSRETVHPREPARGGREAPSHRNREATGRNREAPVRNREAANKNREAARHRDGGKPREPARTREPGKGKEAARPREAVRPKEAPRPRETLKPLDPADCSPKALQARKLLEDILAWLSDQTTVSVLEETKERIRLEIEGDKTGLLIGKRGQTLDALQFLVGKMVNRTVEDSKRIEVDMEQYRRRREQSLRTMATRLGDKVKKKKKPITIEAMNAHDRRIIHLTLKNDRALETKSVGKGEMRKLVIHPANNGKSKGHEDSDVPS